MSADALFPRTMSFLTQFLPREFSPPVKRALPLASRIRACRSYRRRSFSILFPPLREREAQLPIHPFPRFGVLYPNGPPMGLAAKSLISGYSLGPPQSNVRSLCGRLTTLRETLTLDFAGTTLCDEIFSRPLFSSPSQSSSRTATHFRCLSFQICPSLRFLLLTSVPQLPPLLPNSGRSS